MRVEFACRPGHTVAYCFLEAGEAVNVERDAMAFMSAAVDVEMGVGGSLGAAVRRKAFGGEGALMARYVARASGAWVAVTPHFPGDMVEVPVRDGERVMVESGNLVAFAQGVKADVRFGGSTSILLGEGVVLVSLTGSGTAVLSAYGGIQPFELVEGQTMIVDAGHLIAWDSDIDMRIGMVGGAATAALSGEGLVVRFTGPGRVWAQTRSEKALLAWFNRANMPTSDRR